jgi:hypothetical protein
MEILIYDAVGIFSERHRVIVSGLILGEGTMDLERLSNQ